MPARASDEALATALLVVLSAGGTEMEAVSVKSFLSTSLLIQRARLLQSELLQPEQRG